MSLAMFAELKALTLRVEALEAFVRTQALLERAPELQPKTTTLSLPKDDGRNRVNRGN